jgi:hypothetical protein
MADYYTDTAGSNTAPYDTWVKAATDPQTVVDLATAGDTVYARGTFTQAATLDFNTNNGTAANPIMFIGMNASGVEDETLYTLDGNSAATNNILVNTRSYVMIKNVKGTNATSTGYNTSGNCINVSLYNCEFLNSGLYGIFGNNTNYRNTMIRVRSSNSSNIGIYNACREGELAFSEAIGSGVQGIYLTTQNNCHHCLAHNNANVGFQIQNSQSFVSYGIADGNTSHGIQVASSQGLVSFCRNTNNGGYGLNHAGSTNLTSWKNSFFNNTSGATNGNITAIDDVTLTSDGYTDRVNDDFSLATNGEGVGIETFVGATGYTTTAYPTSGYPPQYSTAAAPTFAGITHFEILSNNKFYVQWTAASAGTVTSYRVYIRDGNSSVFATAYLSAEVDDLITSTIVHLEGGQSTLLKGGSTYHCGVKAANGETEDSNTVTLSNVCSGSELIQRQTNTNIII